MHIICITPCERVYKTGTQSDGSDWQTIIEKYWEVKFEDDMYVYMATFDHEPAEEDLLNPIGIILESKVTNEVIYQQNLDIMQGLADLWLKLSGG